ncbi:hypothetical protein QET93_013070 [Akkermansia sp. N21116]|uniref:hypothetical protein n=1 Tax=Akkermansia sp. N21116 TaxID=3040764 RepID=UPI00244EE3C0|nr:hypothetical protein [Akkermansia sp. N21116]WPX40456.1 hypothetical protein QET93_013070 [Akkermansia sp. N21116]
MQLIYAAICYLGWCSIFRGFYLARHRLSFQLPCKHLWLFFSYVILCIIMIVRGYLIDYPYQWFTIQGLINFHFFQPTYILPYLMPLFLLWPISDYDFRPIVKASVLISIIVIIAFFLFYDQILSSSIKQSTETLQSWETSAEDYRYYGQIYSNIALVALCRKYVSSKVWIINIVALLFTLLINMMGARRGNSATIGTLLLFNIYFYIKSVNWRYKIIAMILTAVMASGTVYLASDFSGFDYLKKRGMHDSRSKVDEALTAQMNDVELWVGKGLNGRYYFPLLENDKLNGWRYGSETGYYNLVLKGGYLLAWTYILLLLYPALLGIFKSRNTLCKALGFIILLSLLELYPFGHLTFNLKFLVIWMGIALLMSPKVRNMNDDEIRNYYFLQPVKGK